MSLYLSATVYGSQGPALSPRPPNLRGTALEVGIWRNAACLLFSLEFWMGQVALRDAGTPGEDAAGGLVYVDMDGWTGSRSASTCCAESCRQRATLPVALAPPRAQPDDATTATRARNSRPWQCWTGCSLPRPMIRPILPPDTVPD